MPTAIEQQVTVNSLEIIAMKERADNLSDEVNFLANAQELLEKKCNSISGNKICSFMPRL